MATRFDIETSGSLTNKAWRQTSDQVVSGVNRWRRQAKAMVLPCLCCIVLGCSSKPADDSATGGDQGRDANEVAREVDAQDAWAEWDRQLDEMVETLGLSEQERATLANTFKQQQQILEDWWAEGGQRLKELDAQVRQAVKERDLSSLKRLKEQAMPLRQWLTNQVAESERAILDSLSPEQRDQWQGHVLVKKFKSLAGSMELTSEQMAKVRELAVETARKVRDETNPQAAGFLKLEQSIEQQVFDELQKKAYEKIKKKNPLRSLKDALLGG